MQTNPVRAEELAILDAQIDTVYTAIKGNLDWSNLVPTLIAAARVLETLPGLKGPQRLHVLQKTLKVALKESTIPIEEKEAILYTIETVVPIVMQAAILASKNPIVKAVVQEVEEVCVTCCWTKK